MPWGEWRRLKGQAQSHPEGARGACRNKAGCRKTGARDREGTAAWKGNFRPYPGFQLRPLQILSETCSRNGSCWPESRCQEWRKPMSSGRCTLSSMCFPLACSSHDLRNRGALLAALGITSRASCALQRQELSLPYGGTGPSPSAATSGLYVPHRVILVPGG